jgi:DNA-binding NarL/FixJ family response regulator
MLYKIILADDHQFLLQGLLSVLKDMTDIEVVDTALNGIELMTKIGEQLPDLVILDLNMPGYDGLECLRRIRRDYPATRTLVLTNYNQQQLLDEVKKSGADGYLVKNSSSALLKESIDAIRRGEKVFATAETGKPLPEDSYFFDDFLKKYKLTKREVDIIRMIAREMTTREIAAACFLSELTISTHRKNIFRKLDLKNVASLVNFAKANNII